MVEVRAKSAMGTAKTAFKEAKALYDAIAVLVNNLDMQAKVRELQNKERNEN